MTTLPAGLLSEVKNYLDITWNDNAGDEKLSGIILRGMSYIDKIAGSACNFIENDKPKELLFEYCRYTRSNALSDFQTNYLHELLSLQIAKEVEAYESDV